MESDEQPGPTVRIDDDEDEAAPTPVGDKPEADTLEQARPVAEGPGRSARRLEHVPEEVPEADWFEQSVAEPVDEEER